MRVKEYCCDASRLAYRNYYVNQVGSGTSGIPIYVGSRHQRGHGLGNILSSLFKSAAPVLKRGLTSLGKSALQTGISIAGDVLSGKDAKESAKSRAVEGIKSLAREAGIISNERRPPRQVEEEPEKVKGPFGKRRGGSGKSGLAKKRRRRTPRDILDT